MMGKETPRRDRQCGGCLFFRQYYMKLGRRYVAVDCGHCAHPEAMGRRIASETCPRWMAIESERKR